MSNIFSDIVDLLCLVYHEARNVRHPIKARKLQKDSKYDNLIQLPRNRERAWELMEKVRVEASWASRAADAAAVFAKHYTLTLDDLQALYEMPCWKGSAFGGNRWAPICERVRKLVACYDAGGHKSCERLLREILEMEHNTGIVREKLRLLKEKSLCRGECMNWPAGR